MNEKADGSEQREMKPHHVRALRTAIRLVREAQGNALVELAKDNSADNRKNLHEIADTLKTLRSIQKEEQSVIIRILKWLHVIP